MGTVHNIPGVLREARQEDRGQHRGSCAEQPVAEQRAGACKCVSIPDLQLNG